jgi:hypothetical protein
MLTGCKLTGLIDMASPYSLFNKDTILTHVRTVLKHLVAATWATIFIK